MSRSSPSARANHQRSFDVNWQPAGLHHPRGWLQRHKQTARPGSKIDCKRQAEVPHSFPPFYCFSSSPTALFSDAQGRRPVTASISQASGMLGGDAQEAQRYGGAGGCQKPGGALRWVSALRPLVLRATQELWRCPGQAARRKARLMQLHERQDLPSTMRMLSP